MTRGCPYCCTIWVWHVFVGVSVANKLYTKLADLTVQLPAIQVYHVVPRAANHDEEEI